MNKYESNLVWIDLEMTGLNLEKDTILEISTIITNNNLDILACGPSFVINHSDIILDGMDEWNTKTHTKSGLVKEVKESMTTMKTAEAGTLEFIKTLCKEKMSPLCGNSVWQDRIFLDKYMPELSSYLNYRIIDISSIKELARRWYPKNEFATFKKPENHRACEDIKYSIEELKHYRKYFFIEL